MSFEIPPWVGLIPPCDKPKFEKASKADLTPIELDADSGYAEFSGRHGYYRTTLGSCYSGDNPCGGGYPCKHMYRLAMMLGLIPGEYKNDLSKVKYQRFGIALFDAVDRVESVSPDAQEFLLRHLMCLRNYHSLEPDRVPPEIGSELESAKLLARVDEPAGFRMHPDIDKSSYRLYQYLKRKLDWDSYFYERPDGSAAWIRFPSGSQSENVNIVISSSGVTSSGNLNVYHFPDDEITALLTRHGCNRCQAGFDTSPQLRG